MAGRVSIIPSVGFVKRTRERLVGNVAANVALSRLRKRIETQPPIPMLGRPVTLPDAYAVFEREPVDSTSELLVRLVVHVDAEGDYAIVLQGGPRLEAAGGWSF